MVNVSRLKKTASLRRHPKAAAGRPGSAPGGRSASARPSARRRSGAARPRARVRTAVVEAVPSPGRPDPAVAVLDAEIIGAPGASGLTEEERIESSKYESRGPRPRLFEEERFLFPDTYGLDRVRLLVKDPEWLFAHWDVSPDTLSSVRNELGERTAAVSRLTLRVTDAVSGGDQVILVPEGARAWYVRADPTRRSYQAEIGLTLPSGQFRSLARSNTVHTPWLGPAAERATRVVSYKLGLSSSAPAPAAARGSAAKTGPWQTEPLVGGSAAKGGAASEKTVAEERGGASDRFRPASGEGDAKDRGGASDRYHR